MLNSTFITLLYKLDFSFKKFFLLKILSTEKCSQVEFLFVKPFLLIPFLKIHEFSGNFFKEILRLYLLYAFINY